MRNLKTICAALGVLALATTLAGAALAGTATKTKVVTFSAKYSGTAVTKVTDNIADISATGTGTGTLDRRRQGLRARARATPPCSRASRSPAPEP